MVINEYLSVQIDRKRFLLNLGDEYYDIPVVAPTFTIA